MSLSPGQRRVLLDMVFGTSQWNEKRTHRWRNVRTGAVKDHLDLRHDDSREWFSEERIVITSEWSRDY